MKKGSREDAIACCYEAITLVKDSPEAYFKLHEIYFETKDWESAIHWGNIAFAQPIKDTFITTDPAGLSWRPALSMSHCLMMVDKVEEGYKFFKIAKNLVPDSEYVINTEPVFLDKIYKEKYLEHFMWMFEYLKEKDCKKLEQFVKAIPNNLWEDHLLAEIRNQCIEPVEWKHKSIAIFCGRTPDLWAPPSIINGVGGSEEAVIYMGKELTNLGYEVTVYCNCGYMAGEYNGVTYKSYADFNSNDNFSTVISWRTNII